MGKGVGTDPLERSRAIYEEADNLAWRLVVYEPLHEGWEFTNVGGRRLLDAIGARAGLNSETRVLELCSGLGATCRYLAKAFGSRVTGVELSPYLVEQAGGRAAGAGPGSSGSLRFEQGDVTRWRPNTSYDVVLAIESLVLLEDIPAALATAREALRPGGRLFLAEVSKGPHVTPGLLRAIREEDGMASVLGPQDYRDVLRGSGFSNLRLEDRTEVAAEAFTRIREAIGRHGLAIVALEGRDGLARWERLAELYCACFESRELTYYWIEATRP